MQRHAAGAIVSGLDIGFGIDQHFDHCRRFTLARILFEGRRSIGWNQNRSRNCSRWTYVQRRIPIFVTAIYIRPALDQYFNEAIGLGTEQTCQMHSRLAILIFGIDISIATFQQLRYDRYVANFGRAMQEVRPAVAASIVRWRILLHHRQQLCDQSMCILLIVLNQWVESVYWGLVINRKECIFTVPSNLIVTNFVLFFRKQKYIF